MEKEEIREGIRSAPRNSLAPLRPAWLATIRRLQSTYAELADKSPAARRAFCLEYLDRVGGILSLMGLGKSNLLRELDDALQTAQYNERHPLFRLDQDPVPAFRANFLDADIEASAAVILAQAVDDELGCQRAWCELIAKALGRAGYRPRDRSAYSPDAIRKWREACERGDHPSSQLYRDMRADLLNMPADHSARGSAEEALDSLVQHCRGSYRR
jgi:hypothetical protein